MPRKSLIVLFFLAFVGARHAVPLQGMVFAQQPQTECPPECTIDTMEIVTWYPSPYNEYEELRLYPKRDSEESLCDSFEELGLMYYNQDQEMLKVCRLDSSAGYRWEPVSYWKSSGANVYNLNSGYVGIGKDNPSYDLDVQGKINTVDGLCINSDCKTSWSSVSGGMSSSQISTVAVDTSAIRGYTKVTVDGADYAMPYYNYYPILANNQHSANDCISAGGVIVQSDGVYFCKFSSSSCPSGWTQYQNWSTTTSARGCGGGDEGCGTNCVCGYSCCDTGEHPWSNVATESCWHPGHRFYGWRSGGWRCPGGTTYAIVNAIGCY